MSLERQTSPSDNFRNAFMGVNLKYVSYYGEKLPYDATEFMLQQITGEYFTTGIEFFVNGQNDPYLKDLGETAVEALTQNLVHPYLVSDLRMYAREILGLSEFETNTLVHDTSQPFCVLNQSNHEKTIAEDLHIFFQLDFYKKAQQFPLLSLADIASTCSMIRDFVCMRRLMDKADRIKLRATVASAHVLAVAHVRKLPSESTYTRMQEVFPQGFRTVSTIPLWYTNTFFGVSKAQQN